MDTKQETVGCSAVSRTSTTHFLLQRLRDHSRTGGRKVERAIEGGDSEETECSGNGRTVAHMNTCDSIHKACASSS